jgi:hypothetical protein
MRSTNTTMATDHMALAQPSFQDYLRISQTARSAARRARREAVPAFWCAVSRSIQRITRITHRMEA